MAGMSPTIEGVVTSLREAPARIATVSEGVAPERLRAAPAEGEWSAVEVLAHLRACADMWGGAIGRIVAEDRPALEAINPTTWIKQTDYPRLEFGPSFAAFRAQRAALLAVLAGLPPEGWARAATVKVAYATSERSVFFYAEWLARHERSHVRQIARTVQAVQQRGAHQRPP